ncbi:MAG: bifunctional N(6)-L-threonylcarbamoyladenine synthase/serine/threonine protein kinase [archaeon]|nr:bifunctional N(6)-L-threonylcarbamoyladenine synthase/serine/threonine protein kinase [archaeon]
MITLGIEGTAHTLGVGIVDDNANVLANVLDMYKPASGGLHPREAANHHSNVVSKLIEEAIVNAKVDLKDVDVVAFSKGPGLGPCLRVAATASRSLSLLLNKPIVGVNHCIAHVEIGRATTRCVDPMLLYVSGGNTQVIAFSNKKYRIFGETLDIGIGNMFDKLGRELGLGYYAGPTIEKLAGKGTKLLELPYSVKGMDVSFSGIMTAALNLRKRGHCLEDIAFSVQEICFGMLAEVSERAMAHLNKNEILLGGGVAQNTHLRDMVQKMAEERGARVYVPDKKLCVDNGAMIAWLGSLMYSSGVRMRIEDTAIVQKFRTDDVDVTWRS